jgi:hypothetical protein
MRGGESAIVLQGRESRIALLRSPGPARLQKLSLLTFPPSEIIAPEQLAAPTLLAMMVFRRMVVPVLAMPPPIPGVPPRPVAVFALTVTLVRLIVVELKMPPPVPGRRPGTSMSRRSPSCH